MKATKSLTAKPVESGPATNPLPEFGDIRTVQNLFSLKRTYCFNLVREGKIKSVLLRRPGNKSGKRLVHLQSVREWLLKQMESTT